MNEKMQQLLALQRIAAPSMERERVVLNALAREAEVLASGGSKRAAKRASKGMVSGYRRPPSRSRPIAAATEANPARVADEPKMALAFYLRRMTGIGWEKAGEETASEFNIGGECPEKRVQKAAKAWKHIVLPQLIEWFPDKADRLREFLR